MHAMGRRDDLPGLRMMRVRRRDLHSPQARVRYVPRPFGIYVHVPYCAARCGYCDFNTYVAPAAERAAFAAAAIAEVRLAARMLDGAAGPVQTVFFGGGTPTLLPAADLGTILDAIRAELGLAPGAEVTVEANPESADRAKLAALREHGVTRVSFGMQSSAPHVLATLDRRHTPGRAAAALRDARAAGFEHVSADLIYGTPGETDDDWRASLDAALAAEPDHVSAYALTVERGTRLAARVGRREIPAPDEDALADRYAIADETLRAAGLRWYEVSNWAASEEAACRHNLGYWRDGDWWGIGPGAHSHLRGVRWWNVKRPADYARRVHAGESPEAGREVLGADERRTERVMLGLRLAEGLALDGLGEGADRMARRLASDGLLEPHPLAARRAVLTLRGRLLADTAVRELLAA
jgi:putative oxygen-independent coproporphyrinogen III oxidase